MVKGASSKLDSTVKGDLIRLDSVVKGASSSLDSTVKAALIKVGLYG